MTQPVQLLAGIRGVRPADLPREVMAGVTLAALAIPLNIGYAQVAGLPPSAGLYAALIPLVVFALLSSSRQLVAGPDAPIAALIGSLLLSLAPANDPKLVQLAFAQALVCALIFFGLWALRLGFLANFLSRAVLIGFISGLGIEVFTSQIPKVLGISVEGDEWLEKVVGIVQGIEDTNVYALIVSVGTFVVIRVLQRVAPQLPGGLIALVVMTVIVAGFGLADRGVSVLGPVSEGLARLGLPQVELGDYVRLLPGALAICGITLADGLLVGRNYAEKRDYRLDAKQKLFAFGAANVAAGVSGSMTIGSSGSRTAAVDGMNSRDIDTTAADALQQTVAWLDAQGVRSAWRAWRPACEPCCCATSWRFRARCFFSNREAVDAFVAAGQAERPPDTAQPASAGN